MFRKKRAVKYSYKITFVSASGVEDGSFVHIAWKRGSKSANHGETEQKEAANGSVDWNETVTIPCTLFKSSGTATGYDPKELSLSLTSFDLEKKKDVVLGKIIVDLGAFADCKEPQTKYHNVKAAKKISAGPFVLVVTYAPVLVGEGGDDEAMSETDAGDVSDEEEEPAAAAAAVGATEDPFAAENVTAASTGGRAPSPGPKKTKSVRRSKKSAASTSALIVTSVHDTSSSPKKSASPVPSSGSSDKLADVIRERDELRARVGELESSRNRSGSRSRSKGEVEALQKQNKQLMKKWEVLNELFDGIKYISYSSSGKPMTSTLIVDFIRKGGQPDDPEAVAPVSSAIKMALNAPMNDFRMPLLWVSTLHYALQDLGASVATVPAPESLDGEGRTAAEALTFLLVRAFSMTLDSIYRIIEPACSDCFITPSSDSHANNAVVNALADVSAAAKNVHLAPSIRKQLMSQIVYDIDATVFNVVIADKTLCSCDRILKIRQAMSTVERWLLKDAEISSAKRQLQLIREVANLFMMDESVLSDDDAIGAAFSVLNIRQIATLLEMFKPDDLKKESVDPNLIRDLKVKAVEVGERDPLEVDGHRWFNLPKEKAEPSEDKKKEEDKKDDE